MVVLVAMIFLKALNGCHVCTILLNGSISYECYLRPRVFYIGFFFGNGSQNSEVYRFTPLSTRSAGRINTNEKLTDRQTLSRLAGPFGGHWDIELKTGISAQIIRSLA